MFRISIVELPDTLAVQQRVRILGIRPQLVVDKVVSSWLAQLDRHERHAADLALLQRNLSLRHLDVILVKVVKMLFDL
jgi:hypothetical protein